MNHKTRYLISSHSHLIVAVKISNSEMLFIFKQLVVVNNQVKKKYFDRSGCVYALLK